MCWEIAIPAIISAIGAGVSYENGQKSQKMQKEAAQQMATNNAATLAQGQQQINAAQAKAPNTEAIQSKVQQQAQAGGGGATMLSGPQGVDPNKLALSKNSLLGT